MLSVIIPTFNSAKTLKKALDSIICQTFTDWEVLIMDGVSADNTLEIARSYNDSRIRIYSEPDKGIYDAMNKGIKKANGEWLYFLGSDDWLLNNEVLHDVFSFDIDQYDVVYGDVEAPQLAPEHSGEWTLATIDYNRCHQGIIYKKNILNKLGYYNLKYKVLADYEINIKWLLSKDVKKKYIKYNIAHYSDGGFSITNIDLLFSNDYPYLLLKRGWFLWGKKKKLHLIKESLNKSDISYAERVLLEIWEFILILLIRLKDSINNL